MNVAYHDRSYPTNGPFPILITWVDGDIQIKYDQEVDYRPSNSSHFFLCALPLTSCDSSLSQSSWSPLTPSWVMKASPTTVILGISQYHNMTNLSVISLAFLWRESPVKEYLGSSVYSRDEFALPSPPWKYSVR